MNPYQYQQHSNGPPQPPWQSDPNRRGGWHDPRLQNMQSPPPPPAQSPASMYHPQSFGPISGQPLPPPPPPAPPQRPPPNQGMPYGQPPQYHDTSGWGVGYNHSGPQHQNIGHVHPDLRPTLPPRPSSTIQNQTPVTSSWNRPALEPQPDGTWQFPHLAPAKPQPPTPPPRPPPEVRQQHFPTLTHSNPQLPASKWGSVSSSHSTQHHNNPQFYGRAGPGWDHHPSHVSDGTVSPIDDERRSVGMPGRSDRLSISGKSDRLSISGRSDNVSPMPGAHVSQGSTSSIAVPQFPNTGLSASILGAGPANWELYQDPNIYETENDRAQQVKTPTDTQKHGRHVTSSPEVIASQPVVQIEKPSQTVHQEALPRTETPVSKPVVPAYLENHSSSPEQMPPQKVPIDAHRTGSTSTEASNASLYKSGTIDSVMEEWNRSTARDGKPQAPSPLVLHASQPEKVAIKKETTSREAQTDFPPEVRTEIRVETKVETKVVETNPYEDIKDQYAGTLKRFAGMLRQEAAAESDEEKFKIFQGFVIRELRLRSVLYGVDSQSTEPPKQVEATAPIPTNPVVRPEADANNSKGEKSLELKAVKPESEDRPSKNSVEQALPITRPSTNTTSSQSQVPPQLPLLSTGDPTSQSYKDDSYVIVDAEPADTEYSPGGRPRIPKTKRQASNSISLAPAVPPKTKFDATPSLDKNDPRSPGINAPMTLDDYVMPHQPRSPAHDAPMVVGAEDVQQDQLISPMTATLAGPLNFQPPRPTYTPFRLHDRAVSPLPPVREHGPSDTYNLVRQTQAVESGRILSNELTSPTTGSPHRRNTQTPMGRKEHEEAFIGLIRRESKAIRKRPSDMLEQPAQLRAGTPLNRNTPSPFVMPTPSVTPNPTATTGPPTASPLTKAVKSLRSVIPKTLMSEASVNPKLGSLLTGLSRIPDDFSFINATVLAWDQDNRKIRSALDAERAARQSKNEARVDQLFNDDEIGYADIGALEAEFKLDEAGKKYQEDKLELESFVSEVYEKVVSRFERELGELSTLQTTARDLLDVQSEGAGRRVQSISEGKMEKKVRVPMTEVMDLILQLHSKAEIRYQKLAEAQSERERRRKGLERSVLLTNHDTPGVKKLEKDFLLAETRHVFEESRARDERANKLMDSFDRAVVRGLAENQAWIDEVQSRLQLVRDLVLGSEDNQPTDENERNQVLYGTEGVRELAAQAKTAIELIQDDSQRIVRLSNAADKILNEADYAMYVAEEKLANAPAEKWEKLKQDKSREDDKIREDYEARMEGVNKPPKELLDLVKEVSNAVGSDSGHKNRMGIALEQAIRRNERQRGDSVTSPILSGTTP